MDEATSLDQTKRQTINPLQDEINRVTEPLLKEAIKEFGFELPLTFRLYNQIRFYEKFGKLKMGTSVASKQQLAEQFGVTPQQIDKAYDNLTSRYKLGKWVVHSEPIFRNVRRTWMSNARLAEGGRNSYAVGPELLHGRSKTPTAEELALEGANLAESKKKVSRNNNTALQAELVNIIHSFALQAYPGKKYSLTDSRKRSINKCVAACGEDTVKQAITNIATSKWWQENRNHIQTLDWLFRKVEHVEQMAEDSYHNAELKRKPATNLFITGD